MVTALSYPRTRTNYLRLHLNETRALSFILVSGLMHTCSLERRRGQARHRGWLTDLPGENASPSHVLDAEYVHLL